MKKVTLVLLLILLYDISVSAQGPTAIPAGGASIIGETWVSLFGIPMPHIGVTVWCEDAENNVVVSTVSDKECQYELPNLEPGTYTVFSETWVYGALYTGTVFNVEVVGDKTTVILMTLYKYQPVPVYDHLMYLPLVIDDSVPTPTLTPTSTPSPTITSVPPSDYWVRIEKATTEYVVLRAGAHPNHKGYSVYLNVCEEVERCEWWPPQAVGVLTETWWIEPVTIYWEDIGKSANPGDTARIWWDCSARIGDSFVILYDIVDTPVVGQVYLPIVSK